MAESSNMTTSIVADRRLNGWVLFAIVVIALDIASTIIEAFGIGSSAGFSSARDFLATWASFALALGFGAACLWLAIRRRRWARGFMIVFFSIALVSNLEQALLGFTEGSYVDLIEALATAALHGGAIAILGLSQRAKIVFAQ